MRSTFNNLETARRALAAQQTALSTTANNIANSNTKGYSRQRVNLQTTTPYPTPSLNQPKLPGQLGTGVEAKYIERIREEFLDIQYRSDFNKQTYWENKAVAFEKMEDIMNEPSEQGLAKTMDRFWQSLQDLATNPENSGARSVVVERGRAVAETFNYLSNSLQALQKDFRSQIDTTVKEINTLLSQVQSLNAQIANVEPHGYVANDLYDQRAVILDKLSSHLNVKVDYVSSGGLSVAAAEGKAIVTLLDTTGASMATLVDGNDVSLPPNLFTVHYAAGATGAVTSVHIGATTFSATAFQSQGGLRGLIESYGYDNAGITTGAYPTMIAELDAMAHSFATAFNNVHVLGRDFNGGVATNFFNTSTGALPFTAQNIQVALTSGAQVAASIDTNKGNGDHALVLSKVFDNLLITRPDGSTVNTSMVSYYQGVIGAMAVESQEATRLTENSSVLALAVDQRRQSVSGVSLDEEMTEMMKFQHAYNAAARNMTAIDEMLDVIVNRMGVVGR